MEESYFTVRLERQGSVLIFVLLLGFAFLAEQTYAAGEKIGNIRTAGSRTVKTGDILSKVRSRVGNVFDADTAAADTKRIAQLPGVEYSYYNTAVVEGKIQLTFVVVEKNIVRSISFLGNHKYRARTLAKKAPVKVGDYIDAFLADSGAETIADYYRKKGFAFVEVTPDKEKLLVGQLVYTIDEGPRVRLAAVRFSGNDSIKTAELKKVVKTKKRRWFFWSGYYNEAKIAVDVLRLQNVYQKKGFLNSKIAAQPEFNADKNRVRLIFAIEEGQVYTVEQIIFSGNSYFAREELASGLKLQPGQVYSEPEAEANVRQILKVYREIGFVNVVVKQRREFVSGSSVNVEFEVTEGERLRIGQINISGNERTQDKVVRRILDEYDFQPGQWYNADIARGDGTGYLEKLIRQTTYMESARIIPAGQIAGQRDAHVSVIEGQTGSVMLGAGVASDSGVIGQLVFEQRNFDISDKPESFGEFITGQAFKGAGQNLRISLQPGTIVSEYSISFTEPYLNNKPVSLDLFGSSYERWRESYDEGRTKGFVGFEKRYKNKWRRSVGFRAEQVDISDIDIDAPKEIKDVRGDNALYGVRLGVGKDVTDDRFNPSTGHIFSTTYEQDGGEHSFGVLSGTYRVYRTIHKDLAERKTVLATKLHAGTVFADAPPYEKFYAGGQGSLRGFDYRGVSTRGIPTTAAGIPIPERKRKDPIGSDWIFLANAEVTVPLVSENFAMLFFVDSGTIDTGNYRAAVGTGVQILIPQWFGPVPMRFELAAPFLKDDEDNTQVFSFSIGRLF